MQRVEMQGMEMQMTEMYNLSDIDQFLEDWTVGKELDRQEPTTQFAKLAEEVGELAQGILKKDLELVADSIGDICVVLKVLSLQYNLDFKTIMNNVWGEIKDRRGKIVNGTFVKGA